MEKIIEVGKYYEFKRTFGKVIKGRLLEWNGHKKYFKLKEFDGSTLGLDGLNDKEFESMKEIEEPIV